MSKGGSGGEAGVAPAGERQQAFARYLAGDEATFLEVDAWIRAELRRCYPALREELADLSQTVHEKLLVKLREGSFEQRSALRTYVTGIAHHTALDRMRKLYRDRALMDFLASEPRPADGNPYRLQRKAEDRVLLHQVLLNLPERCQQLWQMIFIDKLPQLEIARRLGIPEGTVKSRMWNCRRIASEAMQRLRKSARSRLNPGERSS